MISIKVNGNSLELPDDFSLSLNAKSPVFNEMGSYTYPFKVKYSPRNAAILNFMNRPQNAGSIYSEFSAEIYFNNILWMQGTLKLKIANNTAFDCVFYPGEGEFYYQMKNKNLQDFDYGGKDFSTENDAINWINDGKPDVYPLRPCSFPMIFNDNYFDGQTLDEMKWFNFYSASDDQIHLYNSEGGRIIIIPMLYQWYVLEKLFSGMGYKFQDYEFTSNEGFKKLVLFNTVNCNNGVDGYWPYEITNLIYNYHVPRLPLNDFITGFETFLGLRFFVSQKNKIVTLKALSDVLSNPYAIDFNSKIVSISLEPEEKINGFKLAMELDGDDESFKEQIDGETALLNYLKGSVQNVTDLPPWPASQEQEIRYVISVNRYYKMTGKTWVLMTSPAIELMTQYIYKDAQESISSKFSTLKMGGNDMYCNVLNTREQYLEITPRVFFSVYSYYGGQQIVKGNTYSSEVGTLFYDGTLGLFKNRWKDFLDFRMRTKLAKIVRYCDFLELRDLDFSRKYAINGVHYLIKDYQVTVKKNGLSSTTFSMYPVL